ncbi:MAG: hypothetical protein WAL45_12715, partial [Terracidiphilus sp.]
VRNTGLLGMEQGIGLLGVGHRPSFVGIWKGLSAELQRSLHCKGSYSRCGLSPGYLKELYETRRKESDDLGN